MEMDEMKLKLSTKFMRGMVAKLISKAISKKFGYEIEIEINEIEARIENGKVHIHANVDAETDNDELIKIVKSIGGE